jgi:hypothetical protein
MIMSSRLWRLPKPNAYTGVETYPQSGKANGGSSKEDGVLVLITRFF